MILMSNSRHFNKTKIIDLVFKDKIPVTNDKIHYKFNHLMNKLKKQRPKFIRKI
jgi:hypothetical protein